MSTAMDEKIDRLRQSFYDPNQCQWQVPEQCDRRAHWQVKDSSYGVAVVCHDHLTPTCQTWASSAPLTVNPMFANWQGSVLDI
jgi:hypothetical protein